MQSRWHTCPRLAIKFTCHVCVRSSCHIIIARPDVARGRWSAHLTDPWHRTGRLGTSRRPPPYQSRSPQDRRPEAAIRRPRSHYTAHLSASVPTTAPRAAWHWQGRAALDRASPCMEISLTIPPRGLSLKHIAVAPLTPWPTHRSDQTGHHGRRLSHPDAEWH